MNAHRINRRAWRRKAGRLGLAAALLALGGCVYYPNGPYGGGYYAPAPAYYGPNYYQRPYRPY